MANPFRPVTEQIAEGVWRHAGDLRQGMNVYFLADADGDGDGVTIFDAGTSQMTDRAREAAETIGPIKRIVLGHSHADHRGIAKDIDAPVYCHPDERADAESDGGYHYFDLDEIPFRLPRLLYPWLLRRWDCGPLEIAGTVSEGDDVCGFEVKHFPGHSPGLIGLWRERDRLALVSDTFYVVDSMRFKPTELPNVPSPIFNQDTEQAIESVRKLAALEPRIAAPGHAEPVKGEPQQLRMLFEQAAERAVAGTAWD
jgi:glyoxylase-like metal-dependent hydrolase (beta-lactamase superfamily II)